MHSIETMSRLSEFRKPSMFLKWLIITTQLMMGALFLLYSPHNGLVLLAANGLLA